jgi:transcriptional regulator GlxA family with amidase domain
MKNVAILLYQDVELLDFAGPLEVFSTVNKLHGNLFLHIETVSEHPEPIKTANGLMVHASNTFGTARKPDLLIIPGGMGSRKEMLNPRMHAWIEARFEMLDRLLTVCTGALIPAKMGLLDGQKATTHIASLELLKTTAPQAKVVSGVRFTDNGKIVTSAGISAGIDASLHIVEVMYGKKAAREAADYMEYTAWK